MRPIVRDAIVAGLQPRVFGVGWQDLIDPAFIAGEFLPNVELPAAYASAHVVLNDHWPDMAAEGFLSNRLFDACATGTRVVSDPAVGLEDVFGDVVRVYQGIDDLAEWARHPSDEFPDRLKRLELARAIARDHSFDARAETLIDSVQRLRGGR
jgi:spore maturation protein CgeB